MLTITEEVHLYNTINEGMLAGLDVLQAEEFKRILSNQTTGLTVVPGEVDSETTLAHAIQLFALNIVGYTFHNGEWKAIVRTWKYTKKVYGLKPICISSEEGKVYLQLDAAEIGLEEYQNVVLFQLK